MGTEPIVFVNAHTFKIQQAYKRYSKINIE